MPQLGACAKDAPQGKVYEELVAHHDEVDCQENGGTADQAAVEKEQWGGEARKKGWEAEGRGGEDVFGAEYEVGVFHHEDTEQIQREVRENHGAELGAKPLATGSVSTVALTCAERDRVEVDGRAA